MLLEIDNLSIAYENEEGASVYAAKNVSLTVDRGQVLGLVGESGSGKSTVSLCVPRLLPSPPAKIASGSIRLDGQDILGLTPAQMAEIRGKRIGVIFQEPMTALSPLHRVGDQIAETVLLHGGVSKAAARQLALEWLAKVGIPDPAERSRAYPHELSGGMQQRVMIACALVNEPDLVIADEPTTALDVTVQAQVLKLLSGLIGRSSGAIFITHDLGVVSGMATKIAVMKNGEVVEKAEDVRAFFADPKHPYSKSLVGLSKKYAIS